MHTFTVWAPKASSVDLILPEPGRDGDDAPRTAMTRGDDGWWSLAVEAAGHGTDYAFGLDGGPALPDPRTAWQPAGVHGPSRVFDPEHGTRADGGWAGREVLGGLFYELHVGTFTAEGTFAAAAERLDHLVDLGVDVVEVMPVAAFEGRWGWGYDGVALFAVHDPYGGPEGFAAFVDACHARGLAVCLDVVYNHLGPTGNYLPQFGPYFTEKHHTPWGAAVNLDDDGSEHVRRYVVDNALRWLRDFRVDALRLDAVHALVDDSPTHVLAQLAQEVAALETEVGRPLTLVAESDLNDPRTVEPVAEGGLGMDGQWADDVHHALHSALTGEQDGYYCDFGSVDVLARCLTTVFRHAGDFSTFREKPWGKPVDTARHRGHQFLAYLQNHDQVGNRAVGDRMSATVPVARQAAGAALVLTSAFTPMVFMGEEWGASTPWQFFTDFTDPELAEAVRNGRRSEFASHGWDAEEVPDPQDPATRGASVLDWSEPGRGDHAALLAWSRDLVALRRAEPDLRADDLAAVGEVHGDSWVTLRRGRFDVLVNLGDEDAELPVRGPGTAVLAFGPQGRGEPERVAVPGTTRVLGRDSVQVVRLEG